MKIETDHKTLKIIPNSEMKIFGMAIARGRPQRVQSVQVSFIIKFYLITQIGRALLSLVSWSLHGEA